jgi:hypothetical protein
VCVFFFSSRLYFLKYNTALVLSTKNFFFFSGFPFFHFRRLVDLEGLRHSSPSGANEEETSGNRFHIPVTPTRAIKLPEVLHQQEMLRCTRQMYQFARVILIQFSVGETTTHKVGKSLTISAYSDVTKFVSLLLLFFFNPRWTRLLEGSQFT